MLFGMALTHSTSRSIPILSLLLGLVTTGSVIGETDRLVLQSDRVREIGSKVFAGGNINSL